MERINVIVSDEAKRNLIKYKEEKNFKSLDDALDDFLKQNEDSKP